MSQYSPDYTQEQVESSDAAQDVEDALLIEQDKSLIKNHPLFTLLEMLFEKCEEATRGDDVPTSSGFDDHLQEFVRRRQFKVNSILSNSSEIDNLMIKAIQVLRIHLLELEKVNELCKDFCHRYITCLKGKMHSEGFLRADSELFRDGQTPLQGQLASTPNANVTVNLKGEFSLQGNYQTGAASEDHSVEHIVIGSTPLSQVGISTSHEQVMPAHLYHSSYSIDDAANKKFDDAANKKLKRGILPKQATEILRSWLFSRIVHPYPTDDEKRTLAAQTNLTLLQVNNWFINARRRILQPMLDANNQNANVTRSKKGKPSPSRLQDRYWMKSNSEEDSLIACDDDRELDVTATAIVTMETG